MIGRFLEASNPKHVKAIHTIQESLASAIQLVKLEATEDDLDLAEEDLVKAMRLVVNLMKDLGE